MRRPSPRIPLPSALSAGPFRTGAGAAFGISDERMRGRDLVSPFRGVRLAASVEVDFRIRCRSYALRMPPRGFFCSVTAARLWGAPLPPAPTDGVLHVGVVAPDRAPRVPDVAGHKYVIHPDELADLDGLPVTAIERTWCDLAAVLPLEDLVAAGDALAARSGGVTSIERLMDAVLRHPGRRGRARLVEGIALLDPASESAPESRLRVLMVRAGITGFVCNATIAVPGARYRGDFVFRRERVVVEYDGDYHRDRDQWRRDMTRQSRLEAAGWRVIRINADDLRRPGEVAARIRSVLGSTPSN